MKGKIHYLDVKKKKRGIRKNNEVLSITKIKSWYII